MDRLTYINKTVRGYLHKVRDIPCEDYSGSYGDVEGRYYIAAIADGHGDKACFRSGAGSKSAVEIAIGQLKDLAEVALNEDLEKTSFPLLEQLRYPKGVQMILKGLTDRIISKWYAFVNEDLIKNPPTDEEYESIGDRADSYRSGEHLEHIYGTTLIAALWLPGFLILIQQGDGRCDVFYADGSVSQPIPWDSRCHENVTTSLCDTDVDTSIRHCVIDLNQEKVVACFLGSDGVEDSFPDPDENQAGTHYFYQKLAIAIDGMDRSSAEAYLDDLLPEFSERGSGDDVSVAGLIDNDAIKALLPDYAEAVRTFETSEQIRSLEAKIISKQRKHGVLQRKYTEAKADAAQCNQSVQICQERITRLTQELEDLRNQQTIAFSEMQEERKEAGKARDYLDEQEQSDSFRALLRYVAEGFGLFRTKIEDAYQSKTKVYETLSSKASAKASELETKEHELSRLKTVLEAAQSRLQQAQEAFEQYDAEYQRLCSEKQNLLASTGDEPV